MGDRATLNIDDVGWQSELLHNCKRYCGECLVDFDTLHVTDIPPGPRQGLFDVGGRPHPQKTRAHAGEDITPKPRRRLELAVFSPNVARPDPSAPHLIN